jgi:activator of HSP90 ATPase
MDANTFSRRAFAAATGAAAAGLAAGAARSAPDESLGISGSNSAIHQEVVFDASPERVYAVLTEARLFDKVVLLSGAVASMALKATPSQISAAAGGAFSIFGDYITGRHVELTPGVRVIQAWRAGSWPPHIYSIVRFELAPISGRTRLQFDHTGFPNGEAISLATGWQEH